jgi:hypothetical protein
LTTIVQNGGMSRDPIPPTGSGTNNIPEPTTMLIWGVGLAVAAAARRRVA